ncbi:hypothetical protein ACHAWF_012554 [Thalassiosira exigua]
MNTMDTNEKNAEDGINLIREEAHWSSFRHAVAGLQVALVEKSSFETETKDRNSYERQRRGSLDSLADVKSTPNTISKHSGAQHGDSSLGQNVGEEYSQSALNENSLKSDSLTEDRFHRGDRDLSHLPKNMLENNSPGGDNIGTKNPTLELVGLEEVNRAVYNKSNFDGNGISSPVTAPSQMSPASNALTKAEQQLAEMKLRLAMTESERDELEFILMQSKHG